MENEFDLLPLGKRKVEKKSGAFIRSFSTLAVLSLITSSSSFPFLFLSLVFQFSRVTAFVVVFTL